MKNRNFISMVLFLSLAFKCAGQGTDMRLERKPGLFAGITAGTVNPEINHSNSLKLMSIEPSVKSTFSGSIDLGYMISKFFGFRTGFSLNSFNGKYELASYSDAFSLKDDENETYELRVTGSDITENESFKTIRIPFGFILNIPVSKMISFFAEPDLGLSVPVGASFNSTGLFTYKGYYPEYNVLLENLPNHKFLTNTVVVADDKLELKKSWADLSVFGGLGLTISRKIQIKAGVRYLKSASGISEYNLKDKFHLSPSSGKLTSFLGGSSEVSAKYIGFGISMRYFINR